MSNIEVKKNQALATINFQEDAGKGVEGVDKDSIAIPFLQVLQPSSPAIVDELVEGAKAGMMMNTVTNKLYVEADIVPVAFQRRFTIWEPRESGGGFKGITQVSEVDQKLEEGILTRDEKNKIVDKAGLIYTDTRQHYVLIRDEDSWVTGLIAMKSTQIRRSKKLMTQIGSFQMKGVGGEMFNPPSFARYFKAGKTEKESNDDGTWFSWNISPTGLVEDPFVYNKAREFHKSLVEDKVKVDYSQAAAKTEGEVDNPAKF